MEQLSERLRAALSMPGMEELQKVLSEKVEEAQLTEQALRRAIEKTCSDLGELENSMNAENEAWQVEKKKLEAAVKTGRRNEEEEVDLDLSLLRHEIKMMGDQAEEERVKMLDLEKHHQRFLSLLEQEKDFDQLMVKEPERLKAESDNWIRWTEERVDSALSTAMTTAAFKQKWLKRLKINAEKCTEVRPETEASTNSNHMPSLIDVIQSCNSKKTAKFFIQTVNLQVDVDRKFQKKMGRVLSKAAKQEAKIRAAELKERRQLEKKIRKELEKIQKAETKERKKREKKERREAKKLAKKKEKEEKAAKKKENEEPATTGCGFFFWRRSPSGDID